MALTHRRRRLVAALALTPVLAACSSSGHKSAQPSPGADFAPVAPAPVALAVAAKLAHPIRIGLIVSQNSQHGEGGEDLGLAAGALVAEYRSSLGAPGKINLEVQDDSGRSDGSARAVKALIGAGVVGIVYASEGPHIANGLAAAAKAGVPVLLPYAQQSHTSYPDVFFTDPTSTQVLTAERAALASRHLTDSFVITAGTQVPDVTGLAPASQTVALTGSDSAIASEAAAAATTIHATPAVDNVLVFAPASTAATVVSALQRAAVTKTVLLSPQALTNAFATDLTQLQTLGEATTNASLVSVGVDPGDLSSAGDRGAFLSGLRLAAASPTFAAGISQSYFASVGLAGADTRAHDAVVALAAAAAKAPTEDAAGVAAALRGLTVTAAQGLAGPALTFSSPTAVADADVMILQSTPQAAGQRSGLPQSPSPLSWFQLPGILG